MIEARFDDLRAGHERSFRLDGVEGVIEAHRPDEVAGAIEAAESASRRGLWVAGFVSYEAAPGLDPDLTVRDPVEARGGARLPLVWFAMFGARVDVLPPEPSPPGPARPPVPSPWRPGTDHERFIRDVETIRELIAAGETYQVNHTLRLRARIEGDARGLYRDLCLAQRGAYAAYLDTGRHRIACASPELFFERRGSRIITRPMKGTVARGRWQEEDAARALALAASEKDRAENAMIVDLLRNDLGRVAAWGTVRVPSMFDVERFETVWQMTSTVEADVAPERGLVDLFRALFPCGSVTGAPKARTMRAIAEIEDDPRGVYCGAVGYLAPADLPSTATEAEARFAVAIRTVVVDAATGDAEYGVGSGITYASDAETEYGETLAKTRVLATSRPAFALLETLRADHDGIRNRDAHLARLSSSAEYFGFRFDRGAVEEAIDRAAGAAPCRIRLTLSRDGACASAVEELPASDDSPVRIALIDDPVDPGDVFLHHKTTHRGVYDRRRAMRPDVDDVVLVNTRGQITESTIANVAALLDGRWRTPPRDHGLLAGIGRGVALAEGRLTEGTLTPMDLQRAEAIALVSDLRGWRVAELVP